MRSCDQELDNYDSWKLRSRDDEIEAENRRKRTGFGGRFGTVEYEYKVTELGNCPCCGDKVLEDELFVEEDDEVFYHFYCYNEMKKEESKDDRK